MGKMEQTTIDGIEFAAGNWPLKPELDTIVFFHGSGGTNILWHRQVEDLADQFNTIAINLPGHGNSAGEGMDRVDQYARFVLQFVDSIAIKKPVVCGLSIGGAIVLQLLIERPEAFKGGIVVNSGAKLKVMPLIFEMIEKDYQGFVKSMATFGISKRTDPSLLKPLAQSMAACPPHVTRGDFTACDAFDVMGRLAEIKKPVMVMAASDDQLTPVKYGRFLSEQITGSKFVAIEDAGHLSPIEKPHEVEKAIRDFVASL